MKKMSKKCSTCVQLVFNWTELHIYWNYLLQNWYFRKSWDLLHRSCWVALKIHTLHTSPRIEIPLGLTPLHRAAVSGHLEILKLMVDNGVDKRPLFHGATPLQYAASSCKWRCCMFLCEFNLQDIVQFFAAAWGSRSSEFRMFVTLFGTIIAILLGCILRRLYW